MFYPVYLLFHQHKDQLAPCWHAAMNDVKTFKKYYNTAAIKKINVTTTCKEIFQVTQLRNRKRRFSLYLSSQLMYGVTRIFSYQVEYYQKELLEIWKIFDYMTELNNSEESFNAVRALDTLPEIELPLIELKLLDRQMEEDLHILPGEIPDNALKVLMQDATCLNFGILTNEELDFMLEHGNDITLQIRQTTDNKHKSVTEMTTDIEIAAEVHREMHSPRAIPSSMLVDKSKITDKYRGKTPSTPQKRQPRQPQVETPSKRRRISLENIELPVADTAIDIAPFPLQDVPMTEASIPLQNITSIPLQDTPMPEQAPTRTMTITNMEIISSQHMDINMELESLHSSLNTFIVRRKKLVIDKKIILTDSVLKKWHKNISFEYREMEIPRIYKISSVNLLTRPSRYLAQPLHNLFINHTERPCKSINKDTSIVEQYQEEVRGLQRTVDEHTGPTTSKLIDLEQPSTEQFNTIPIQTTWAIDEPPLHETKTGIDDANDTLEDIDILLKKMEILSTSKDQISLSSTRSSQYALLTSQDIIAMLEVLWHDHLYVKFSDLIPKDTDSKQNAYTKQDAATVFCILLELQFQKKLILKQQEFYSTLWIQKYEDYSD